jgi:hypothetical protein
MDKATFTGVTKPVLIVNNQPATQEYSYGVTAQLPTFIEVVVRSVVRPGKTII